MRRQRTESLSPESKVVTSARNYEYSNAPPNWMAPDASPGVKSQVELPRGFWRANPQESPLTPSFSPFTTTPSLPMPPPQAWSSGHTTPGSRDDGSWPLPQRSISYSNLEGMQSQPPYGYSSPIHQPQSSVSEHYTMKPRISNAGLYPPTITTANLHPSVPSPVSANETHPHSAGMITPNYSQWQQHYTYQKPAGSIAEPYAPWNPSSHGGSHHAPLGSHGAPPFGYGDPASGPYYPSPPSHHSR